MAGDIKDAGGLADIVRFGVPWHGRVEGGVLYTGKLDALGAEITRAWPQPASGDCWLIQAPQKQTVDGVTSVLPGTTLPDPYLDAPEAKAAAALEGKDLTNYALVTGAGNIHGKAFARTNDDKHRWIWIDDNGDAFAVTFGLVDGTAQLAEFLDYDGYYARDWSFSGNVTARFRIKRFGDIKRNGESAPVVTLSHVMSAADMGQDGPALDGLYIVTDGPYNITGGNMILRDLSQTGDKAIMEIHSSVFDTTMNRRIFGFPGGRPLVSHREYSNPLGFVQFTLSGTGAAPVVGMSVLASRTAALGVQSHTRPGYSMTSAWVCDECITTPDGVVCEYACSWHEVSQTVVSYADRVVGYGFDAAGTPQPHLMARRVQYDNDRTVTPTTFGAGTYADSTSRQTTVTVTVGANVYTLEDSLSTSESAELDSGGECTSSATTTFTSNSGVSDSNYSVADASNCNLIAWDAYRPQSDCGTSCRLPSSFTPHAAERLHTEAFVIPTLTSQLAHPSGVFRLASNLYAVLWGAFSDARMGATCLISRHQKDVAYTVWDGTSDLAGARFYGARNPATGEIAWPKTNPVNFT